ncbi:unnamed protein product [Amoebophrya sp. A25]|nr:unnamed protein product [Amoebophrya sp. A25]|eukprot:GSA25T00019135001.1
MSKPPGTILSTERGMDARGKPPASGSPVGGNQYSFSPLSGVAEPNMAATPLQSPGVQRTAATGGPNGTPEKKDYAERRKSTRASMTTEELRESLAQKQRTTRVTTDASSLQWLNVLVGTIWPHAKTAIQEIVEKQVIPDLQQNPGLSELHFARFNLGSRMPKFGPIVVHKIVDSKGLEKLHIELKIEYQSDIDMLLDSGYNATVGIRSIFFDGTLNIIIGPLLDALPLIGTAQVFFANVPTLDFGFEGIAAISGLEQLIIGHVEAAIRNKLLLPNKIDVPVCLDKKLFNMADASMPPPKGVLRVRVTKARHLAGAKWKFGDQEESFTSDPVPVYRLGGGEQIRGVQKSDTTAPDWTKTEDDYYSNFGYFLAYSAQQEFNVELRDPDEGRPAAARLFGQGNFVSHLGETGPIPLTEVDSWKCVDEKEHVYREQIYLDTSKVATSMLHVNDPICRGVRSIIEVEAQWMKLSRTRTGGRAARGKNPYVVLLVKVHEARNVSESAVKEGLSVTASIRGSAQGPEAAAEYMQARAKMQAMGTIVGVNGDQSPTRTGSVRTSSNGGPAGVGAGSMYAPTKEPLVNKNGVAEQQFVRASVTSAQGGGGALGVKRTSKNSSEAIEMDEGMSTVKSGKLAQTNKNKASLLTATTDMAKLDDPERQANASAQLELQGGITGQLAHMVDKMIEKRIPPDEIADIISFAQRDVEKYINYRIEMDARESRKRFDDETHSQDKEAVWHQVLPLFVAEDDAFSSDLWLTLQTGKKKKLTLGQVVVSLAQLRKDNHLARTSQPVRLDPESQPTPSLLSTVMSSPTETLINFFMQPSAVCSGPPAGPLSTHGGGSPTQTKGAFATKAGGRAVHKVMLDFEVELKYLEPAPFPSTDHDDEEIIEEPSPQKMPNGPPKEARLSQGLVDEMSKSLRGFGK